MKQWYQSKTLWANIISTILGILPLLDSSVLGALGITNIPKYLTILVLCTTVLNLILRAITNTGITGPLNKLNVIINEVSVLPDYGVPGEWYHIAGNEWWYYKNNVWSSIIGGRPTDRS